MKYTVFEVDYTERTYKIGETDEMAEARKIARAALKESKGEFPCFVMSDGKCVADIRMKRAEERA